MKKTGIITTIPDIRKIFNNPNIGLNFYKKNPMYMGKNTFP